MNVTDTALYAMLASVRQLQQTTQGVAEGSQDGDAAPSFQEMLGQQRQEMNRSEGTQGEETQEYPSTSTPTEEQPKAEQSAAAASVLAGWMLPMVTLVSGQQVQGDLTQDLSGRMEVPQIPVGMDGVIQLNTQVISEVTTAPMQAQQAAQLTQQSQTGQQGQTGQSAAVQSQGTEMSQPVPQYAVETQTAQQNGEGGQDLAGMSQRQEQNTSLEGISVQNWQMPVFGDLEGMPVQVADATVDMTASAQEVETQLMQNLSRGLEQGSEHVEIRLTPENLGTVVAEFTRTPEGALHVLLHAETEQTAKLLGEHASALGAMLQEGNQGRVQIEVTQPQQQQAWQQFDQDGGHQQQPRQRPQSQTQENESESFAQQLRLGLVGMEQM